MPGLLDPTSLYPDFLDPSGGGLFNSPEYRRARIFDTMGGIGAALLAAGSQPGADFGSSLATGLAGGVAAGRGSEDRFLKRAMVGSQVAKNRQQMKRLKAWEDLGSVTTDDVVPPQGAEGGMPAAPAQGEFDLPKARAAIKGNESGGRYDAVGPDTGRGRAYGAYQVMDFNIGPWTQAVLGRAYTPEEFLADPRAQDAVFDAKFGEYWKQYGNPQDAASMWFSGRPVQQAGNASDVLGTTVPAYLAKFNRGMTGGVAPPAMEASTLSPNPVAPGVAQGGGDASGSPVQPAQYAPPPQFRPQSLPDVVKTIPPSVRKIIFAMDPDKGMPLLLKYADPGSEAVLDTQSGQVVFIPKTMVGRDPRYQPVKGAELDIQRRQLANSERKTDIDERSAPVTVGNDGRPRLNPVLEEKADADTQRKMLEGDYADVRKANTAAQEGALVARSSLANIDRMSSLLDQVATGRFAGTTKEIKSVAKSFGVDLNALGIRDDVAPAEAAQALSNQIALTLRNPSGGAGMPGAMSDQDREFLRQMIPSLETTPEGRRLMVDYMRRVYQRSIDVAKISNDYMRSPEAKRDPSGVYQKIAEYANANPLFDPQKDVPAGGMSPMPSQGGSAVRKYNPATGKIE